MSLVLSEPTLATTTLRHAGIDWRLQFELIEDEDSLGRPVGIVSLHAVELRGRWREVEDVFSARFILAMATALALRLKREAEPQGIDECEEAL